MESNYTDCNITIGIIINIRTLAFVNKFRKERKQKTVVFICVSIDRRFLISKFIFFRLRSG